MFFSYLWLLGKNQTYADSEFTHCSISDFSVVPNVARISAFERAYSSMRWPYVSTYSVYIPSVKVLTTSIVVGWLLSVSTLGQWSHLGYVKGSVGGTYPPRQNLIITDSFITQSQLFMHWLSAYSALFQSRQHHENSEIDTPPNYLYSMVCNPFQMAH